MQNITFKSSILWTNIGEVAAQTGILAISGYQYAHFCDSFCISPQNPAFLV